MLLTVILLTLATLLVSMVLAQVITNSKDYKFYRPTYEALMNKQMVLSSKVKVLNDVLYTFNAPGSTIFDNGPEIIFFCNDEDEVTSIKLLSGKYTRHYIHDGTSELDPYTQYWFRKICKALLTHDLNTVETI